MAASKGKTAKPSKMVKPKKTTKRTTQSHKNHRFQPFSERIAKLKIDPIRRKRNIQDGEALSDTTDTYLGRSLTEWRDLNMSQTFATFAREVAPLCDSLPVVLHNEERIMDILLEYIEKGDALAMEPLLSLMSHFAHDLDTRFEKHFARAVSTVAAVASKHDDPSVVEWSFTCLAWLFKYLSRLLTPDLRPLYDLMSPYLGKESQKSFIIRFAAESMSFLIRKAAATYERDAVPLDRIIGHVLDDCVALSPGQSASPHDQGVMTLLTEAIKGVQQDMHSSGLAVLKSLLKHVRNMQNGKGTSLVVGSLTSLIHYANSHTFQPVTDTVLSELNLETESVGDQEASFASQLLFAIISVRKGTRIQDWTGISKALSRLVRAGDKANVYLDSTRSLVTTATAIFLQTAPVNVILPKLGLLDIVRDERWAPHFLPFCDFCARLGAERFEQFVLPQLQKFITTSWAEDPQRLLQFINQLTARGTTVHLQSPRGFQDWLVAQVETSIDSKDEQPGFQLSTATLALKAVDKMKLSEEKVDRLKIVLKDIVKSGLDIPIQEGEDLYRDFATGTALQAAVGFGVPLKDLWQALCEVSTHMINLPAFSTTISSIVKGESDLDAIGAHTTTLQEALVRSLALPSHQVRADSLDIIESLYKRKGEEVPELLSVAILIESTPLNLETSRSISMNIRRLAAAYKHVGSDALMQQAIPTYCFGLLHVRLAQAWGDATEALSTMTELPAGEETIVALAQSWLEGEPDMSALSDLSSQILDVHSEGFQVASDFECSNLSKLDAIAKQVHEEPFGGYPSPTESFRKEHTHVPVITATTRSQALRVLDKIPQVAEKRSRLLVPVLLRWAGLPEDDKEAKRWSRKDQKAMLAVFAKFNNPRVLYRSNEVHDALLQLCANGDVEIQRSALKAILAWKEPALKRHQEHLTNFLDEARFREEVSVFLQGEGDESLQADDHPAVMPVLLRVLYGRLVGGAKDSQHARRKAVFVALSTFEPQVLGSFIDIALHGIADLEQSDDADAASSPSIDASLRQHFGMLNMVSDMLETLGPALEPYATRLADAALTCSVAASKRLDAHTEEDTQDASLLRNIRQSGMQCLVKVFADMEDLDLATQGTATVTELVSPRLGKFAAENAQGVSAALRLFAAWAKSPTHARHLFEHDDRLVECLAELLGMTVAKDEVKVFILRDILDKLLSSEEQEDALQPYITAFVTSISQILGQQPASDLLAACVASTTKMSERITNPKQAEEIIQVCAHLLRQPGHFVHPSVKAGLVRTMMPLLETISDGTPPRSVYEAISGLFSRLRDVESRVLFSSALAKLCKNDSELSQSAKICIEINALASGRLNEPDHERKEQGFAKIYEYADALSQEQWLPLMHNCLLFIRDEDDTVNRSSASRALEVMIVASGKKGILDLIKSDLFPAIQRGMKEPSELVRAEYLRLLGLIVVNFAEWVEVSDMTALTVEGDEEASFFTNALHIQQHRRLRALRRLAEEPKIRSHNISRVFLPLLEQFIFDQAEGDAGRTLSDQAVQTIGSLAKSLKWSDFRTVMKRYLGQLKKNPEQEKVVLRLIGALVDGLTSKMGDQQSAVPATEEPNVSRTSRQRVIIDEFLPPLTGYLHLRDESTVDRRVAVAVSIVKLLRLLSEEDFVARLAPTLTDISHILRSRDLEAREQTRRTMGTILSLVGSSYLSFILRELRSALQRGYQLHVLSFTVHYLLVSNAQQFQPGNLDSCLPELMAVIMDDIFGVTGQEKDAEEYKTGMKEIKSSKSYDTMEILARMTSIPKLGQLILPIRAMLQESLDSKMVKKIDDLIVRLRKGVDQNPAADSRDMLVFCHEIVRQVYAQEAMPTVKHAMEDYKVRKYLIASEQKASRKGATASYLFKLSSFALNLVRKIVRRHEDLMTPANLAGYLPMIGDALVKGQEEVQVAAVKLLTTIIRVPIADIDANAPVYLKEAVGMIKASTGSTTESAKAGIDLITAILREKRDVQVKERDIAYLLKTLKQDLDEPDRQGILFRFLRAVLGRKVIITEVYEVMDEVAKMMVTNPDSSVRQSARSAYLQFVLDYPQGKDRWTKQTGFLIKNLDYEHVAGRRSVMEVLHSLLGKLSDEVVQPLLLTLFVGMVPRLSGDTDKSCRDMAGLLIGRVFERADEEKESSLRDIMSKWMDSEKKVSIRKAALLCWTIFVRSGKASVKQTDVLLQETAAILQSDADLEVTGERQLLMAALELLTAVCDITPERAFSAKRSQLWTSVQQRSVGQAIEFQETAAKLQGLLYNDAASTSSKLERGLATLPLRASGGLELGIPELKTACAMNLRVLRDTSADATELVAQTVRNLVFLGRVFAANGMQWKERSADDNEEDEVEEVDKAVQDTSATGYLLSRLSAVVRRENAPPSTRTAALQCQTALLTHMSAPLPNTTTIIRPLYSLTDPSIPQPPGDAYATLTNLARETLDLLQKKLGSEAYVKEMAKAKKIATERRDERRRKRRIEAVSEPEKWARDRKRKYEGKKLKAKERGAEARGKRRGW